ncbi:OLC1v1022864C1 [Oldenlandia corymbosa var. corymbosa]|uniref:Formin-like protein n=1 Tax=Oldenlandia corymbosa var. corymbosa TaxID=529605 RepID=A0AAV1C0B7_OLDCO|nr:OLC1v1022864C1 [Oldenlandia corymbosa var. corymbosa]
MGVKVVLCVIASFLLVCALIAAGLGSKKDAQQSSLTNLIDLMERHPEMAEVILAHCGRELLQTNEAVEELEFHIPIEKSGIRSDYFLNSRSLIRLDMHKVVQRLDSKAERTILGCLRKKDLLFLISGDEKDSNSWYIRHLKLIYTLADASSRRILAQSTGQAPAPSPIGEAPAPSHTVSSPSPAPSIPVVPEPKPDLSPPAPSFFQDLNKSSLLPAPSAEAASPPSSSSDIQANKQKTSRRTVVIAVAVTAASTFVVSALLFFCCRRFCGAGAGRRKNDERPLLSLSLNDYSIASPHKSFTLSPSIEKHSNQSTAATATATKPLSHFMGSDYFQEADSQNDSKIEISTGTVAGVGNTSVENATLQIPGKTGLPPLKPPPGRGNSFEPRVGPENAAPPPPQPPQPPRPPSAPSPPPPPPMLKPSGGPRPPVPGAPPPPPIKNGPRPPPPPGGGAAPPRPPPVGFKPPRPSSHGTNQSSSSNADDDADAPKTKLKPFFWDKVLANPDQSMVWHQIKSGSFQFNEEMIESLFGYTPTDKNFKSKESTSQDPANQYIQLIDPKKAQNLAILLKALNVTTEEVCDALQEGNELPSELIQTLLKMAPTSDEELKLRVYSGDLSRLGPAERFLKVLVDIPFAFKRLELLLFMCTLQEEVSMVTESFKTLEAACTELRKSRLFLKLLEAVLKTGNRMNDGTFRGGAQAFKLDTLLKLSDVKGLDGKTTLLHFVVQEIIRSEGIRAARAAKEMRSMSSIKSDDLIEDVSNDTEETYRNMGLQMVAGLGNELENVKRAAILDADSLTGTVAKLGHALIKARDFLNGEMKNVDEDNGFHQTLKSFVQNAEVDIMSLLEEEKRIMALVKNTGDYFHGNAAKDEGLRLFVIVRDFLVILDKSHGRIPLPILANGFFQQSKIDGRIVQVQTMMTNSDFDPSVFFFPKRPKRILSPGILVLFRPTTVPYAATLDSSALSNGSKHSQSFLLFDFPSPFRVGILRSMGKKRKVDSDSPKTKASKCGENVKDGISRLPDEILVNILGFLSLKEAGRTSLLSKRWRNICKQIVRLDFDASKILDRMAATILDMIRICFDLDSKKFQAKIDEWLQSAFARRVERLELNLLKAGGSGRREASNTYAFPNELLGLISGNPSEPSGCCSADVRSRGLFEFKYLRALTLRCVNVSKEVLGFFLRSCPFLEHLVVDGSHDLKDNFEISGPSLALKYLEIWDCVNLSSITVSEVNIVSVKVSDAQKLVLKNVPMLVNMWVSAWSTDRTSLLGRLVNGSWLSPCILQLEVLTLHATHLDVKQEKANNVVLPELFKLKQLTLVTEVVKDHSLIPFTSLIRASPNLEKFALKLGWKASRTNKGTKTRRGRGFNEGATSRGSKKGTMSPLKHLKVVELLGYYGRTTEVELVQYFLDNAIALKSIIIDPREYRISGRGEHNEEEKFAREHAENQLKALIPSNIEFVVL